MSYMPWFPEPGSYIRYYDAVARQVRYRRLLWRRDPLKYPRRILALSSGSKRSSGLVLDELNPSETKEHLYLAYIGVKPGFLFYIYHPYDIKVLKWDEDVTDIDEDRVANISYAQSPYEYPTYHIGIDRDRYPAIQPYNVTNRTMTPEIMVLAALYKFVPHAKLSDDERNRLESGALRSHPWDFGGEL